VLSGRGLCDGLIPRSEESYWLWCVVVCDVETSWMRRTWPIGGCRAKIKHQKLKDENWEQTNTNKEYKLQRRWKKGDQQPSKTQLYKNNKLTSYMFRPSRGHLQSDVWNIPGSIQIYSMQLYLYSSWYVSIIILKLAHKISKNVAG
jgi:hypothetical protein